MAFIDGYNLYHAIDEMDKNPITGQYNNLKQHLKWLNISSLVKAMTIHGGQELVAVHYFSAFATWLPDAYARHRKFVEALRSQNVSIMMGQFKLKDKSCKRCNHTWKGHEEKETDVNIALQLINLAYKDKFDRAVIATADTDLLPAIRMLKSEFPHKTVTVILPNTRSRAAQMMREICPVVLFKEKHLERNLFPEEILLSDGGKIIRPPKYDPPKTHY